MWGYNDKIPSKTPKILQISTLMTFLSFLIILMVIMIHGVITNRLDFTPGFQKYMTHWVSNAKNASLYLEDVLELPDFPVS